MQALPAKSPDSQATRVVLAAGLVCLVPLAVYLAVRYGGPPGLILTLGVATLCLVVQVHPFVFFVPYFGALFFADTKLPGLPLSVNQILAVLFFASWAGFWLRGRCMRIHSKVLPWLTVLAIYFTISALMGESPQRGLIHARYVVTYYLVALMLASCLRSERAIYAYAWIIVGLTFLAAVAGFGEAIYRGTFLAIAGKITDAVRVKGPAANAIVYGWNLVFAFPFAFFLFTQHRRALWRHAALAAGLFILFVSLLTINRQTVLFMVVQLIICPPLFRFAGRRRMVAIIAAFLLVVAAVAAPPLVARLVLVTRLSRDYSYLERRDNALICFQAIKAHPVFGIGLGSYPAVWRRYIPPDYSTFFAQYIEASRLRYPDAGYTQITTETGFVGLAIVLAFMGLVMRRAWIVRREAARRDDQFVFNLAALVLVLMIQFFVSTFIVDTFLYVRVWLIYPLALLMDERMLWQESEPPAGEAAARRSAHGAVAS
jgi:O-antigen ligase